MGSWRCGHKGCEDKTWAKKQGLREHTKSQHKPHKFKCTLLKPNGDPCTFTGHRKHLLDDHIKTLHQPAESRPIACTYPDCTSRFISKGKLTIHLRNVHKPMEDRHPCPYPGCQSRFTTVSRLNVHVRTHENAKKKEEFRLETQQQQKQDAVFSTTRDPRVESLYRINSLRRSAEQLRAESKNKYDVPGALEFGMDMNTAVEAYNSAMIGKSNRHSSMPYF